MFFRLKKRCPYCAHVLDEDGKCHNPSCINYAGNDDTDSHEEAAEDVSQNEAGAAGTE